MRVRTIMPFLAATAAATVAIAMPCIASAAPLPAPAAATIRTALAAVDAHDRPAFVDAFAADATIVDEISPFRFAGTGAAAAWFDRLAAVNRDNGIENERTHPSAPRDASAEGDAGYAVVPVRIAYRQRGKAIVEDGAWTFALQNVGGTWKIAGAAFAPTGTR